MMIQTVNAGSQDAQNNSASAIPEPTINPMTMGYPSFTEVFNKEFSQLSGNDMAASLEPPGPMMTPEQLQPSTPPATEAELYPSSPPVSEEELSHPPEQIDDYNSSGYEVDNSEQVEQDQPSSSEDSIKETHDKVESETDESAEVEDKQSENENVEKEVEEVTQKETSAVAELAGKTMALDISSAGNATEQVDAPTLEESKVAIVVKAGQDLVDSAEEAAGDVQNTTKTVSNEVQHASGTDTQQQNAMTMQAGISLANADGTGTAKESDGDEQQAVALDQKQPERNNARSGSQMAVEYKSDDQSDESTVSGQKTNNQAVNGQNNSQKNFSETVTKQQNLDRSEITATAKTESKTDSTAQPPPVNLEKSGVVVSSTPIETGPARTAEARNLSPTQQIVRNIEIMAKENQTSMRVKLYPESLGKIDLQMVKTADGVTVVLIPELESTGKLLESQLNELRQALTGAGIQLNDLNIGQKEQSQEEARGWRHAGSSGKMYFDDEFDSDEEVLHLEYAISAFDYRI